MMEWLIPAAAFAALFVLFGLAGRGAQAPHGCGACDADREGCPYDRCVLDRVEGGRIEGGRGVSDGRGSDRLEGEYHDV